MKSSLEECLGISNIRHSDYLAMKDALRSIRPNHSARSILKPPAREPEPGVTIVKNFGQSSITLEDRGIFFAIWISQRRDNGVTAEVTFFDQFVWDKEK